jgi:hypothetical protein
MVPAITRIESGLRHYQQCRTRFCSLKLLAARTITLNTKFRYSAILKSFSRFVKKI